MPDTSRPRRSCLSVPASSERFIAKARDLPADQVFLDLEDAVAGVVTKLKERGVQSPYLRTFVVARINPLRWIKGEVPAAEKVLKIMIDRASRFGVEKVKQQDLVGAFGGPAENE